MLSFFASVGISTVPLEVEIASTFLEFSILLECFLIN